MSFYEEEIGLSSVSPESPPLFNINAEEEIGWIMDLNVYLLALKRRAFFNGYAIVYICIGHYIYQTRRDLLFYSELNS